MTPKYPADRNYDFKMRSLTYPYILGNTDRASISTYYFNVLSRQDELNLFDYYTEENKFKEYESIVYYNYLNQSRQIDTTKRIFKNVAWQICGHYFGRIFILYGYPQNPNIYVRVQAINFELLFDNLFCIIEKISTKIDTVSIQNHKIIF